MISISDVGYSEEHRHRIEEGVSPNTPPGLVRLLKEDGFLGFKKSNKSIAEMAVSAIKMSLHKSGLAAEDIDAAIISTESFWDIYGEQNRHPNDQEPRDAFLFKICQEAGMAHAHPYGLWISGCGNFGAALSVAQALVASGHHKNVIVILTDRVSPTSRRISEKGPIIFSDAAAALIVSASPSNYLLRPIRSRFSTRLLHSRANLFLHGKVLLDELSLLRKQIEETTIGLDKFDYLITDNLHSISLDFLSEGLRLERHKLLTPTKANGHSFSCDCALSLSLLETQRPFAPCEKIGLFNLGPGGISFIEIER